MSITVRSNDADVVVQGALDELAELRADLPELLAIADAHERERLVQMDNQAHFDDLMGDYNEAITERDALRVQLANMEANTVEAIALVEANEQIARLTARCERLERVRVTAALYRKLGTFEFEKSREDLDAALAAIEQEPACDCCGEIASACICDSEQETQT